ncbi:MAG: DUF115 domain-containing protein [Methanospirillum sp.]|nr:DUF115 domain-containing protein [Methanospirillum sp.]
MKFEEWEPLYREICDYFCFDPAEDEKAARVLSTLTGTDSSSLLRDAIAGKTVTVCGNAPGLHDQLDGISGCIIAADAASGVLLSHGITPRVIVTDLDGIDEYAVDLNRKGTILVVHAHGDNIPRLDAWIPRFPGPLVCTTQGKPFLHVHNFGGFTDGDRAVFMAYEMGAGEVVLAGFDCGDPEVTPIKKGKLLWAKRLLSLLGHEC